MQILKAETRNDIIAASKALFFASGYRGATMRAVANRVGMSVSNLYKYFADKDDLFEAVVGEYAREFMRSLRSTLAHAKGEEFAKTRVRDMVSGLSRAICADPAIFCILMECAADSRYADYKNDCSSYLRAHMLGSLPGGAADECISDLLISNLFSSLGSIARRGDSQTETERLIGLVFRYHMAGFKALVV